MAYLDDHPPRIRQFRYPRRSKPSGVVVVHTAESFPDETGPDTGAENVTEFIRTRTNHGSYHDLADSDSIVPLVRYDAEAFHDATGSNTHSYGVSAATQAHKWDQVGEDWAEATVVNMARAAARYATWVKREHGVTIPARRISRAESEQRKPGFLSHAERDPDRRTDPGKDFDWDLFLDTYAALMAGETIDPEDDMTPEQAKQLERVHEFLLSQHEKPNQPGKRWQLDQFDVWAYAHAALGRSESADAHAEISEKLDKVIHLNRVQIDAYEGYDTRDILARIDQRAEETQQAYAEALQPLRDRLDMMADLIEQHQSGELDAAQVVEQLRQMLAGALGGGAEVDE